jgi:hypothetical protein
MPGPHVHRSPARLFVVAENVLQEAPEARGKGVSKLWRLVLTGREGAEQRRLVVVTNHSIMDGGGVTLWLSEFFRHMNDMMMKVGSLLVARISHHKRTMNHMTSCPPVVVCARLDRAGAQRG